MKTLGKRSKWLDTVLGILYAPLALISCLLPMASDAAVDATNPVYVCLIHIFSVIAMIVPLLCVAGIILSGRFRKKGRHGSALAVLLLPFALFGLNLILLAIAEALPKVI